MVDSKEPLPSLDALQKHIDETRTFTGEKEHDDAPKTADVSSAMRVGGDIVAGVTVGGLLGYGVDWMFSTTPVFFILGFFFGAGIIFARMIRSVMKTD